MDGHVLALLAAAGSLAALHLVAYQVAFLSAIPRSRWLSAAGGVSVAYVFVHLLPELNEAQERLDDEGALAFLEAHVFLVALLGLALFYGVENHSLRSRRIRHEQRGEDRTTDEAFWLSITSFAVYNAIIGYLLHREELGDLTQLALFTAALGVHFVVNDVALREHHREAYDRVGRWLVAAAVIAGWAVGAVAEISEQAIGLLVAFIGGGVILNVLKEELPGERQARFVPFVAGAAAYATLLQLA